jgi:hypothetical protein
LSTPDTHNTAMKPGSRSRAISISYGVSVEEAPVRPPSAQ